MDLEELKEILNIAKEDMAKSVNSYGPGETLRLLLTYQNQDPILRELLAVFPSIAAMNHLLIGKPIIKTQMTDQALEALSDIKFPIFIKETSDPGEDPTVSRKTPGAFKETRCRK